MVDVKAIRRDPDPVLAALARRGDGSDARLRELLELDGRRRGLLPEVEALRARANEAGKAVGAAKAKGEDAAEMIAELAELKERRSGLEAELQAIEASYETEVATIPNPPDPTAADEDTVIKESAAPGPEGPDHLEIAGRGIDMEAGAAIAGSRFAVLKGDIVLLELALFRWALELLIEEGFEPVVPPVLVREAALFGTGFLPDTEQQIYSLPDDKLYLAGTSEVALASLHAGEAIDPASLPRRYAGISSCFRREAGAAGRDTRGIFRVHQFDKVEMFSFVTPDAAPEEHERLLGIEERILHALDIPYRVVNIAVTDLGTSAAKKYDCEAWMPGEGEYREVTSTSNTTDFQARRLGIKIKGGDFAHTLNGTAVTWRHIIAILENHGGAVPEVLQEWGAPARVGNGS